MIKFCVDYSILPEELKEVAKDIVFKLPDELLNLAHKIRIRSVGMEYCIVLSVKPENLDEAQKLLSSFKDTFKLELMQVYIAISV